jgi:release factor glutamine methyltransferase
LITLVEVLTRTDGWFREKGIESARLEAELILCHVLNTDRLQLYMLHDRPMTESELAQIRTLVKRRGKREPLAWILGSKGFHALDLAIGPGVLVPRPDTETLVETALSWINPETDPVYVADVGCGSGAVGLAIAYALAGVRLWATDISQPALEMTRTNVGRLGLEKRVAVLEGNLLEPIPEHRPVDWVVSNPPYIPTSDIEALQPEISRFEPREALDGGPDGLRTYRELIPAAVQRARLGLLLEVGIHQAEPVVDLIRQAGLPSVELFKDLGGITRVVGARR